MFLYVSLLGLLAVQISSKIVKTSNGDLLGTVLKDLNENPFYAFMGIPYAEPPIGELRFKPPVPKQPWEGQLDATKTKPNCVQPLKTRISGQEDCLFLNVYSTMTDSGNLKKPVMVWIHGGGFIIGTADSRFYGPNYLITADVVLVTIQYRLGPFGFLSFNDSNTDVTGNAAMKDMVLALQWVRNNIASFMGDPEKITIFGESAGAASVHLLVLSPLARGLFHRAICQSGTALSFWSKGQKNNGDKLAKETNCLKDTSEETLSCLRQLTTEQIFEGQISIGGSADNGEMWFAPTIETVKNDESFITEEPLELLAAGSYNKVPMMIGFTNRETLFCLIIKKIIPIMKCPDFLSGSLLPSELHLDPGTANYQKLESTVANFYFGEMRTELVVDDKYRDIADDRFFIKDAYRAVKYHLKTSNQPIYVFQISLDTGLNMAKKLFRIKETGTSHMDDLGYLFSNLFLNLNKVTPGSAEDLGRSRMVKLWTQFARNGDPNSDDDDLKNVKWEPSSGEFNLLDIGSELVSTKLDTKRIMFWKGVYETAGVRF